MTIRQNNSKTYNNTSEVVVVKLCCIMLEEKELPVCVGATADILWCSFVISFEQLAEVVLVAIHDT